MIAMKRKLKEFIKRVIATIKLPEMSILPGQLAFFFVLSMIPLIALLGAIASKFSISMDQIASLLTSSIPKEALDLLLPLVSGKDISGSMVIFYISAFILASNGTHSMIIASNNIYKVPNKDFLSRRIKAIIMTIVLVLLLIFVIIVPAFGDYFVSFLANVIHQESLRNTISATYQILKYPLSLILIYFNIKLLYTMAPDTTIQSKDTTYGALFTTIGWIIATEVYSIYTQVFARYNLFYGSISNLLILLLWVYILAYIFVFGMALNAGSIPKQEESKEIGKKS